jgi:hypothetical protein
MSEWWTYHLSDFLLFSARTWDRLFERYNRDVWPLQLVALAAGAFILILALRRGPAWRGRAIAVILAAVWVWVAWAFQLKRYATINWAAKWFAAAFVIEAVLLIWFGVIRDRFRASPGRRFTRWSGIALFAFALFIEPLIGFLLRGSWATAQTFGITPDPTVVATIGVILFAGERRAIPLIVVPLLWCAISGATWWTLHASTAFVLLGFILPARWRIFKSRSIFRTPEESRTVS